MDTPDDTPSDEQVEWGAATAHEANRAYCQSIGDNSLVPWVDTPEEIRRSARDGVRFVWDGTKTPEQSHENWLKFKEADGWHYGPTKDPLRKTHPAFLPYKELPEEQRIKDHIFRSVVLANKALWGVVISDTIPR